jgi:pimeloyl-ACP methyl ester carboxylesterase
MASQTLSIPAADGRSLEVVVAGTDDGIPIIFHHGTPGAGGVFSPFAAAARERGLRHVTYSRPGYGTSDRHAGRTVADCAADVVAIADALGAERFYTMGGSGGGPHALATAALLPDRVLAATTIASVAPAGAPGLDWLEGMGSKNHEEFAAVQAGPKALEAYLEEEAKQFGQVTGEAVATALGDLVSEVDRAALTGEFGDFIAGQARKSLTRGIWGWFDDDFALLGDWGFDPASITAPLTIWHGAQDRFVPLSHGEWLAGRLPDAQARLEPAHGHLSIAISSYPELLDGLVATATAR